MNEEAAFIAALVADPADRTAALVFADWLDERSDPRGPMMRNDEVRDWMAPKYENPLPSLRAAFESGKRVAEASRIFALIGDHAMPELISLLAHPDSPVRVRAVKALRLMGPRAKTALPALLAMAKDTDYAVRYELREALKEIAKGGGVDVAKLHEALLDTDQDIRNQAASLLSSLRVKKSATKQLAKGLDSEDAGERLAAVEAMAKLRTTTAIDAFCKALGDPAVEVRRVAVKQLQRLASASMTAAIEPLHKALADDDREVQLVAVDVLHRIGPAAVVALPELLRLLAGADEKEQNRIFGAVAAVGVGRPEALEVVLAALHGTNKIVKSVATVMLPNWPSLPASAAPALLKLARNPGTTWQDKSEAQYGLRALARIANPTAEVLDEFRRQLAKDYSYVIADILREGGAVAVALVPELIEAFRSKDRQRIEFARALGKIGGDGITALVQALDEKPSDERNTLAILACEGLEEAGLAALPVLPKLLACLRKLTAPTVRAGLIDAIAAMGPEAASVVPDLIAMFTGDQPPGLSGSIYRALGKFGTAVVPFAPQLCEMLREPARASHHTQIMSLLTRLVPQGVEVFPVFHEVLRQAIAVDFYPANVHRPEIVRAAVKGLIAYERVAATALPDLVLAYQTFGNSKTGDVREDVLEAYGLIGGDAVPHIIAATKDSVWKIRQAAFVALGETGDTSAATFEALRAAETDASRKVRTKAAAIMRKLDKPKKRK